MESYCNQHKNRINWCVVALVSTTLWTGCTDEMEIQLEEQALEEEALEPTAEPTPQNVASPEANSPDKVEIVFYNDGWFYAYADVWARDVNWNEVDHAWSGTFGHDAGNFLYIDPNAAKLEILVRWDPWPGGTLHHQVIDDWANVPKTCPGHDRLTIFVGGTLLNTYHYDLHCSDWWTKLYD
jgi:hypothetical protein